VVGVSAGGGRILAVRTAFNEKEAADRFLTSLGKIEERLSRMEGSFARMKKGVFQEVDDVTNVLVAKAKADPVNAFVRKEAMKRTFRKKLDVAIAKRLDSEAVDAALQQLEDKKEAVEASPGFMQFAEVREAQLGEIEAQLRQLLSQGKSVSLSVVSNQNT
jgi:hypothetical protein